MNGYQSKRVLALLDCEDKLTAWEWDFINSLADLHEDTPLSPKQNHKLNAIAQALGV